MKLAEWRRGARLTQSELAGKLGISSLLVSQWETGRRRPNEENLLAIAELSAQQVMPNDFYDLTPPTGEKDIAPDGGGGNAQSQLTRSAA